MHGIVEDEWSQPVSFAGMMLGRHRHVCAFVSSRDEEQRMLDPFVIDGVERGEKISYTIDPADRASRVRHLRQAGLDMPKLFGVGQFQMRTWSETHLIGGRFDLQVVLRVIDEMMSASRSPRTRFVTDMGWASDRHIPSSDLVEYECRANEVVANFQHVVICVYDTAKFGGDVIVNVLRTHPVVLIAGQLHMNPYYTEPEQFLQELSQRRIRHDV